MPREGRIEAGIEDDARGGPRVRVRTKRVAANTSIVPNREALITLVPPLWDGDKRRRADIAAGRCGEGDRVPHLDRLQ